MNQNEYDQLPVVKVEIDVPYITTTKGLLLKSILEREVIVTDTEDELTHAIEYRLKWGPVDDQGQYELVHRSVHVQLKKSVAAEAVAAMFG